MKKIAFSLITILALSHLTYAGGDIAPVVEPIVETEESKWEFRLSPYAWLAGFEGFEGFEGDVASV